MTTTSTTLLKAIGADADSPRWTEFVARYQPVMKSFLVDKFPDVDADDVMQETLIVIARKLPNYRYAPDVKGHFRNYLLGILKNKAREERKNRSRAARAEEAANDPTATTQAASPGEYSDMRDWRIANRTDYTPEPMLRDGATIGDFAVVGFLGRGGSGEVSPVQYGLWLYFWRS